MECEYCKTKNKGSKYHEGTCGNCGAVFSDELQFDKSLKIPDWVDEYYVDVKSGLVTTTSTFVFRKQ